MKFNLKIFKGKNAIWWIVGAIVLFVAFYLIASGGSSKSSGGVVVQPNQPSEAAIMASAQSQLAGIQAQAIAYQVQTEANRDITLAQIGRDASLAETQAGADVAKYLAGNQSVIASQQLQTELQIARGQMEYGLAAATVASQTQIGLREIDALQFTKQLETNAKMFGDQLQLVEKQSLYQLAATAPKGGGLQRIQAVTGQPITPQPRSSGLAGFLTPIAGAIF